MAHLTAEFNIAPEDGWVLVATDPKNLLIKSHSASLPWFVAVTEVGVPAAGLVGIPMGFGERAENNTFRGSDINISGGITTALVYVRVGQKADATSKMLFTVITE